jgi:hypothetical protein
LSSQVDIYNLALSNIAAKSRVNSLTEDSDERKVCDVHYENAREIVLEDHDWNFASFFETLALLKESTDAIPPPLPWIFEYAYPSTCVKVREITRDTDSEPPVPFSVGVNDNRTGKVIRTDKQAAKLRYTFRITNSSLFTPRAVEAIGWKLATLIAISLTGNLKLKQNAEESYLRAIIDAKSSNYNENIDRKSADPSLIAARS